MWAFVVGDIRSKQIPLSVLLNMSLDISFAKTQDAVYLEFPIKTILENKITRRYDKINHKLIGNVRMGLRVF